jgi:preflagellin peptidase FlaK
MKLLFFISLFMVVLLGALSSYSDIRYKKSYNKTVFTFFLIGLGIQTASIVLDSTIFLHALVNIVMTIAVSILFYLLKIWAAGDSKLFISMVMLIPFQIYGINDDAFFPAFYLMEFIFTVALQYIIIESIVFFCFDLKDRKNISFRRYIPKFSSNVLASFVVAFLLADTCDVLLMRYGNILLSGNTYLLVIVNILISLAVISLVERMIWKILVSVGLLLMRFTLSYLIGVTFSPLSFWTVLIVAITMFVRSFTGQYNYRTISTETVSIGDVLSRSSILLMIPSNVKGVPKYTDETTRCRLTESEVDAIKRWEYSKYGQSTITIVRTVPFAPFIFGGILLYFAFQMYLGA